MKTIVYENQWFSVIKDGKWHFIHENNAHNGAVILLLKDDKKFILVKNYRKALNRTVIELPRGYGENNESSLCAAIREAYEETGYKIEEKNIEKLGSVTPNSAILSSKVDIFFATVTENDLKQKHDDEVIEVIEIDKNSIMEMIASGEIEDAFSLSAITLYMAHKNDLTDVRAGAFGHLRRSYMDSR